MQEIGEIEWLKQTAGGAGWVTSQAGDVVFGDGKALNF